MPRKNSCCGGDPVTRQEELDNYNNPNIQDFQPVQGNAIPRVIEQNAEAAEEVEEVEKVYPPRMKLTPEKQALFDEMQAKIVANNNTQNSVDIQNSVDKLNNLEAEGKIVVQAVARQAQTDQNLDISKQMIELRKRVDAKKQRQ